MCTGQGDPPTCIGRTFEVTLLSLSQPEPVVLTDQKELLQIWLPDTFITNAKDESFSSSVDNLESLKLVMVDETHCMLDYTLKMNARISCQLNYRYYPLDVQYCNLTMRSCTASLSYSASKLDLPALPPPKLTRTASHLQTRATTRCSSTTGSGRATRTGSAIGTWTRTSSPTAWST